MRSSNLAALLLAGALALPGMATAGYLGTVGPVYAIEEEDMLAYIARQLQKKGQDGTLARLQQEMRSAAEGRLSDPPPIAGVQTTLEPRSYYFDPSITLPQSITTPEGRLVAAAGTHINPLDYRSWSGELLFIDGRDPQQQRYAARLLQQQGGEGRVKTVLVAGDLPHLARSWRTPVYYDQGGELVTRFGITQVPAHVYQEGKRIRVDEVLP